MHALKTSFSKEIGGSNRFKSRQNACFRYIAFIYFFAVPNRLKYHHNACFRDIVFIYSFLQLQIVSKTVRMHHLPSLFSFFFAAVQNRLKYRHNLMHALETLFSFFLCSSKSFQNPSESTVHVFFLSLQSQIV